MVLSLCLQVQVARCGNRTRSASRSRALSQRCDALCRETTPTGMILACLTSAVAACKSDGGLHVCLTCPFKNWPCTAATIKIPFRV